MEGTVQTNYAMNAIRMIVFKNYFSLRILISCTRLSVEFCKAMFFDPKDVCMINAMRSNTFVVAPGKAIVVLYIICR
jgi:hypothetical protein